MVGPGLPVTVSPTDAGPVLVGWDEDRLVVRRVAGPEVVPVTATANNVRAVIGEDVTILSDVPIGRATVTESRRQSVMVVVSLLPGLMLTCDSKLEVAAGAGNLAVRVGTFQIAGEDRSRSGTIESGGALGVIDWEPDGLSDLLGAGSTPALLWLAVGRSLRLVAPVDIERGRVLSLANRPHWVLVRSTAGRAMLVPGRGLRIRMAQAVRRMTGNAG